MQYVIVESINPDNHHLFVKYGKELSEKAKTSRSFWKVKERAFEVANPYNIKVIPGARVEIFVDPKGAIKASLMIFGLPLLLFAVAYFAMPQSFDEQYKALAGLGGLVVGFLVNWFVNKYSKNKKYPELVKVLTEEEFKSHFTCNVDCEGCGGCG